MAEHLSIGIVGTGPSGLFLFKKLIDSGESGLHIDFFEKNDMPGAGMPYSKMGALEEHVTNVSANEIPPLVTTVAEWIKTVDNGVLKQYDIDPLNFNEYRVLPRLLFGQYLIEQFRLLQKQAKQAGITFNLLLRTAVKDIRDDSAAKKVEIITEQDSKYYDRVIICTGHCWPSEQEKNTKGFFNSPYPPSKLAMRTNHAVAIKGASLTAIDAVSTLAKHNGSFGKTANGKLVYQRDIDSPDFQLVLHSLDGLLPAVRFHVNDSPVNKDIMLSPEEIAAHREANDGFVSLDYIFEKNFKEPLRDKQPDFYDKIKDMGMEEFVALMMGIRERADAFVLLKREYEAAEKSIREQKPVYWKEMLASLSFAMNHPAKYFSAEDTLRLRKTLIPLISIVIAFVPQSSVAKLMALYEAGILKLVGVDENSSVEPAAGAGAVYHYTDDAGKAHDDYYQTFIDCTGQPHLAYEEFPYKTLKQQKVVSPARIKFRDKQNYLRVPGVAINDHFQVVDDYNALNERIYVMAVPLIGGYNPDYSGLDFCDTASTVIVKAMLRRA